MKEGTGSYAMLFRCAEAGLVEAGRLGALRLEPGYYIYCGSAFGPGGVRARTAHHRAISRRPHWHLDYLRPRLQLLEIWYTFDKAPREHQWSRQLVQLRGASMPYRGFGASDCHCYSHLVRLGYKPSFAAFRRRMRSQCREHRPFHREVIEDATG